MESLDNGVTEVAFKMYGENVGRLMKVHWLILCIQNTIIPIEMQADVLKVLHVKVWTYLKKKLFENEKILKVLHDVRNEIDFMYHNTVVGKMEMRNIFDTQMGVYFMDLRALQFAKENRIYDNLSPEEKDSGLQRLSVCLQRYLSHTVWDCEIALLNHYEQKDVCTEIIFSTRPLPSPETLKYMAVSVKYLSMLRTEILKDMLRCYDMCSLLTAEAMKHAPLWQVIKFIQTIGVCPESIAKSVETLVMLLNVEPQKSPSMESLLNAQTKHAGIETMQNINTTFSIPMFDP